jgi:putative ABC transport system permease protein
MLGNILPTAFRQLIGNRSFAFINIAGLALGLCCFSLILIFVENELTYDRFHSRHAAIYRVVKDFVIAEGVRLPDATTPTALAPAMKEEFPEIETATRFSPNRGRLFLMEHDNNRFYETRVFSADNEFFKVFDFEVVKGSRDHALKDLKSIVLTESAARRYFGDHDPIGKIIRANLNNGTDFTVTAIVKDVPSNAHFIFDILIPIQRSRNPETDWSRYAFYTYALVKPGTDQLSLNNKIQDLYAKNSADPINIFYTQPLADIHLKSNLKLELANNGDILQVKALIVIAIFVVMIAGFNYVNLTVAQSTKRAKEVGIKKVAGAKRSSLIGQFLVESVIAVSIALLLSLVITTSILPFGKALLGYDFEQLWRNTHYVKIIVPSFTIVLGLLAGIYPAMHLSSFQPLSIIKGRFATSNEGIRLRQGLVVLQFIISTSLIIALLVVDRQVKFMSDKPLGFDESNLLLLPNVRGGIGQARGSADAMINEIKQVPGVMNFARADGIFGVNNSVNGVSSVSEPNRVSLNFVRIDYEFIPTMDINLKRGRNFSNAFPADTARIILNETAIRQLGLKEPYIGQKVAWDEQPGVVRDLEIVGVVNDFHFTSFHETIKPFGFVLEVGNGSTFILKMESIDTNATIAHVGQVWKKYYPEHPFDYTFQDQYTAGLHSREQGFRKLFTCFTLLAILIACMGLFGLMAFVAQAKAREIGIRKVLGASVNSILILVSRDLVVLILIAIAIAIPLSSFGANWWLNNFAYHFDGMWDLFVVSATATIAITLVTMAFQAVAAAMANPVESLKAE